VVNRAHGAQQDLAMPLSELDQVDLEAWLVRGKAATSTVGRRIATFRHLFAWAIRRGLCTRSPLAELTPLHGRKALPRAIREQHEQRALDAAIASAPPPYRLIFTILRETGIRAVCGRWGTRWGRCRHEALMKVGLSRSTSRMSDCRRISLENPSASDWSSQTSLPTHVAGTEYRLPW
jgi:hypothetical protein